MRVSITPGVVDVLMEVFQHAIEAGEEELDEKLDKEYYRFCISVRAAKQRLKRRKEKSGKA